MRAAPGRFSIITARLCIAALRFFSPSPNGRDFFFPPQKETTFRRARKNRKNNLPFPVVIDPEGAPIRPSAAKRTPHIRIATIRRNGWSLPIGFATTLQRLQCFASAPAAQTRDGIL